MITINVGEYYDKGGGPVRITESKQTKERGTVYAVEYVSPNGGGICGGGYSCWWENKDFRHITDPVFIAAAKGHDALCKINKAKAELRAAEGDYEIWCRVVTAMNAATKNVESNATNALK